jgi:pimeloyl-ACP methyl ester carboxylesterase
MADGPGDDASPKIIAGTEDPKFARITAPALGLFAVYPRPTDFLSTYPKLDSARRAQVDRAFPAFLAWSKAGRDRFRAEMPHGTVIELTHAGHYVFLTQPDRVEREMRPFLARAR